MSYEKLTKYVDDIAKTYTSEWHFSPTDPDLGSALALTLIKMIEETNIKSEQKMNDLYIEFLNMLGVEPLSQSSAKGIVSFSHPNGAPSGSLVPKNFMLLDETGEIPYLTKEAIYATTSEIKSIYCFSEENDYLYKASNESSKIIDLLDFKRKNNEQKHSFYIYHKEAFDISSNSTISFHFSKKQSEINHILINKDIIKWEYFADGFTEFERVILKDNILFLTLKEGDNFSKTTLFNETGFFIKCTSIDINMTKEIEIYDLSFKISSKLSKPDYLLHSDIEITTDVFFPFGKDLSSFDCFYISSAEIFSKKGAIISLLFEVALKSFDTESIYADLPIEWKIIMDKRLFEENERFEIKITKLSIEYWNGMDFVHLKTFTDINEIFNIDDENVIKKIEFICPNNIEKSILNGLESTWIRVKILEISNQYKTPSKTIVPSIKNIDLNYNYNNINLYPQYIYLENNLEIKKTTQNTFTPFIPHSSVGNSVYIGFDKPFNGGPIGILFETNKTSLKTNTLSFSLGEGKELKGIIATDETEGLNKTGIITLYPENDLLNYSLFGESLFWLKISTNELDCKSEIANIYLNATQVEQKSIMKKEVFTYDIIDKDISIKLKETGITELWVWINSTPTTEYIIERQEGIININQNYIYKNHNSNNYIIEIKYCTSKGDLGNCDKNKLSIMSQSIGYISEANNPMAITGGRASQSYGEVLKTGGKIIKQRNRGLTSNDIESLTYEASGAVLKCRYFENVNSSGETQKGKMALIYLPENYNISRNNNENIALEIKNHLLKKCPPMLFSSNKLWIGEPEYVEMSIDVKIVLNKHEETFISREDIYKTLEGFLNPISGNFHGNGFNIGTLPDYELIYNFFHSMAFVNTIKNLSISTFIYKSNIKKEVDFYSLKNKNFALPINGKHNIYLL